MSNSLKYKPVIVIPAYKRVESLNRLLKSINEANFLDQKVQLIISIDGDPEPEVVSTAKNFAFKSGSVKVVEHDQKLGLYDHILECADYSEEYGSVLILEDDLVVGPAFYEYASKALSFYESDDSISGISLYSQRFNETALLPFEPLESEWPVYFMQIGCSWGQAWTYHQWNDFKQWLSNKGHEVSLKNPEIPLNMQEWPESSWKKDYNYYLISNNKYIVYPYSSFSTNCSDSIGAHMKYILNTFQVPLNMSENLGNNFSFPEFSEDSIRYDCFMESKSRILEEWTGISLNNVEIDLTGSKSVQFLRRKKYAITSKNVTNPIRSFPLSFRPIELNLKYEAEIGRAPFLHLVKSENLVDSELVSKSHYYRMAEYFLYIPIRSRKFAAIYFKEVMKRFMNNAKQLIQQTVGNKTDSTH